LFHRAFGAAAPTRSHDKIPIGRSALVETVTPALPRSPVQVPAKGHRSLWVTTKPGKAEPTRRLSIDLPESWHRRFKIACTRTDKKMIDEVSEFIKRRTLELENE
jgi:hypothetical protein